MTDLEIIPFLGERCMGWEVFPLGREDYDAGCYRASHRLVESVRPGLWNYFPPGNGGVTWNPLTSMANVCECQLALAEERRNRFCRELAVVTDAFMEDKGSFHLHRRDWKLINATARQRCIALVNALGGAA